MAADLAAASEFMATHARLLDRRRFEARTGRPDVAALLGALEGYRNPDGGYGHGLEPDLRSRTSQPGGALHAFEALADAAPAGGERARELCDWCHGATLPDGGLPFALRIPDPAGCAPFWLQAEAGESSLLITALLAAEARKVPAAAGHPWLEQATQHCLAAAAAMPAAPHALALAALVRLVDALGDEAALARLAPLVPADGLMHVAGGQDDEFMRPLDFAPSLFDRAIVDAELDRLERGQQADGGWPAGFASYSPAAALEWRGHATIAAVSTLQAHGRL